jgi:predicted CXXCH cytochrome family protein
MASKRDRKTPAAGPVAEQPPASAIRHRSRLPTLAWSLGLGVVLALGAGLWLVRGPAADDGLATSASLTAAGNGPAVAAHAPLPQARYVDNAECLACHQPQAAAWRQSHHAKAMALPTPETVRANFDNTRFEHRGVTTRFSRQGDKYIVRTEGEDGKTADFEVKYTFGVEPLQQYLIETRDGRLQSLTVAWDTRVKRWFHLLPNEKTPPGDVLHWTGRYQTGNTMCISCHTTNFEKHYDAKADTFASTWSEVNVSCQSCHGPGSLHATWAAQPAAERGSALTPRYGSIPNPGGDKLQAAHSTVQMCAACHSRRAELTATPVPGQPQLDHYLPSLLRAGLYHADGQQLDEVYVDASFRQSKMFQAGVSCSNCHDPHTSKIKLQGNALCLQCHGSTANAQFAKAAGNHDSPAHHHHPEGSAGAQCVACHMPAKNYMQIQARPDHSMRVPRPDLTVAIGTPNACNSCHDDKSAQWAADTVTRWFGAKQRAPHYGQAFAAARNGEAGAAEALLAIVGDPSQPAVVRATALEPLRNLGDAGLNARIEATRDADGEVRATAAAGLDTLPASQRVPTLAPLLKDPLRAVRIAAARSLASLPADQFDARVRRDFDAALAEYIAAQSVALDMPGANLNLGALYESTGQPAQAEGHYQHALKIDPDFSPARANLSRFYSTQSRNSDAEKVLVEGLKRQPDQGELQYSLGLLLAEEQRLPEAVQALAKASALLPGQARVHYNLGLALQQTGQRQAAESALLKAQRIDPTDPATPYALAVLYAQNGQRDKALAAAEQLQSLRRGDAQAAQLLQRLRGEPR